MPLPLYEDDNAVLITVPLCEDDIAALNTLPLYEDDVVRHLWHEVFVKQCCLLGRQAVSEDCQQVTVRRVVHPAATVTIG